MTVRFSHEWRTGVYMSPEGDGGPRRVRIRVELRRDPLTGRGGRVAHFQGFHLRRPDLSAEVAASRPHCPFCPDRVLVVTPRLDPPVDGSFRVVEGESVLFPNISPYDRRSAVVVLSRAHYLAPEDIRPHHLVDGIRAAQRYLEAPGTLRRRDFGLVTWNYMPLAGATQVHPHLQVFATDRPGRLLEDEVAASFRHRRRFGRSYWEELVEIESQLRERWVGRGRHSVWLTPFVSRSVVSDLMVVFPGKALLSDLSPADLEEFARGLSAALPQLAAEGVVSFNLAFYPARGRSPDPAVWLHARLSPRIHFNPAIGGSDATVWQHLLDEPFMVRSPERLAEFLRPAVSRALAEG